MDKKRILIVGDSFCAPGAIGDTWHNLLGQKYHVENRGQCGVGQYKIHQQLHKTPNDWSAVIYLVTSPYRIHTEKNPFYDKSHHSHSDCDLIYEDVKSRLPDPASQHIVWWYENIFDLEHALFMHDLVVRHDCKEKNIFPVTFFDVSHLSNLSILCLGHIWKLNQGSENHLNATGHNMVFGAIDKMLDKMT